MLCTLQTLDRQSTQAAALALVSAAIVTWNTHHMNEIVERQQTAGRLLDHVDLARLSPAIHAHINFNGRYGIHPDQPPSHLSAAMMAAWGHSASTNPNIPKSCSNVHQAVVRSRSHARC